MAKASAVENYKQIPTELLQRLVDSLGSFVGECGWHYSDSDALYDAKELLNLDKE